MNRTYIFLVLLFLSNLFTFGQTTKQELFDTPEKTAGVHYAYPSENLPQSTPVPKGYEAFYISHFGRHGSRYLISDDSYKSVLNLFEVAKENNALTPLGEDVLYRLKIVWKEAEFHGGDLSPLGVREQRGIAERMYRNYPKIFTDDAHMTACATTVVRCALSMDAFCERLKEFNPDRKSVV